ncbi:hypothetical protein Lacal_1782 [Lacinutrix sp. 5H-3-7-4]|nr:hypothetical protein Lacal_1782 [Lacinutrix sp. 5H-3-7-4]
MDRGKFVRTEEKYIALASKHFNTVNSKVDNSYFNIPYTSIILECF